MEAISSPGLNGSMSRGYLAILLHAHLPFVRNPDDPSPRRDDWYLEALIECYLPLLARWRSLVDEGVPFRLTLSISPTLLSMWIDPFLRERARTHLERLVEAAGREIRRTADQPEVRVLAEMYRERFEEMRRLFVDELRGDLVGAISALQEARRLEIITTAATHAFLPGLRAVPGSVRAQIRVGLDLFEEVFGHRPQGFWIPECAWYPGLDEELEREGIRYFISESLALLQARPGPKYGVHAPVFTPSGVAAFGRDPESSEQVWSSRIGYPGDPDYREFYQDIGYQLDQTYLAPLLPRDGTRKDTGFKYHRVTGPGQTKSLYVRAWAMEKAAGHAQHYLDGRRGQIEHLAGVSDRRPIIVAPFDAELFGHWWYEGPEWLDFLIRKTAFDQEAVEMITPSEYLDRYPTNAVAELCPSTWGRNGTNEMWVNGRNDYVYRHIHRGARGLRELLGGKKPRTRLAQRALKQAARELLLAQSSDWTFQMANDDTAPYGHQRFREHMLNYLGLERQLKSRSIDAGWLGTLERTNNLFPDLDLSHFA